MSYFLLTFLLMVRCSAYISHDHRQHYRHASARQDSLPSSLELNDYFIPIVAISFLTSLFTSIGKTELESNSIIHCTALSMISHFSQKCCIWNCLPSAGS